MAETHPPRRVTRSSSKNRNIMIQSLQPGQKTKRGAHSSNARKLKGDLQLSNGQELPMVTEDVPQENIDRVHQRLKQSKATQTETESQFQTPRALSGTTARSYNLAQEPRKSYVDVDVRKRINTMSATTYNNGATAETPMVPSDFHDGSQLTYLDTLASQRDSLKQTATSKLKLTEQRLSFKNKRQVMNATIAHLLAKQATEGEPFDSWKQSSRSDVEPEPQLEARRNPGDVELSVIHRGPQKRKFIDPQPGALRVEFETQGSSLLDKSENHPQSILIEATTDQEESDIEYQQDTRPSIKTPRRSRHVPRKRLASRAVSLLPERARHTIRIDNRQETDTSDASTRHDQSSRRSQGERIKQANSKAKLMKAMAPRKVQTRKAWTDEETKTLIELIEAHGTSWSHIKALGDENQHDIFKNRDQIGLKDKARNIKLDFLKAGTYLPKNFIFVKISQPQVEKLRGFGVSYNSQTGKRDDAAMSDEE